MAWKRNDIAERPAARRGGLTLVELVMAMAITAMIGAAVAAMMYSTYRGTQGQDGHRDTLMCNEAAGRRLSGVLRASKMVLAKGTDYLVLWMGDTKWLNGAPDLSELRRVERDPAANTLTCYQAPANLAPSDDVQYSLSGTDFNAVTAALKGGAKFPGELWATDITAWTFDVAAGNPQDAVFVGYRFTSAQEGVTQTTIGGAALRNH